MLLVDAYNVLWLGNASEPHGPDLTPSGLLRLIAHSRYRRRTVRLVCDGLPPPSEGVPMPTFGERAMLLRLGPGDVVYSGRSGSADDVIERLIAAETAPRSMLVVSSDKRVRRAAGRRRASTLPSEAFLRQLLEDRVRSPLPAKPAFVEEIPLGSHAIDLWRREFGLEDATSDARLIADLAPPPIRPDEVRVASASGTPKPGAGKPSRPRPTAVGERAGRAPVPAPQQRGPIDPELLALMQEWGLRFDLDDLDTGRWLDGRAPEPPR